MVNPYKYVVRPDNGKIDVEHRVIMEKHLNRKLDTNEVVHHLNGNHKDNRIENLVVMSRSEHGKLHAKKTKYVTLTCQWCGQPFEKPLREYKHRTKHNQTEFCCSKQCAGKLKYSKGIKPPTFKGRKQPEKQNAVP